MCIGILLLLILVIVVAVLAPIFLGTLGMEVSESVSKKNKFNRRRKLEATGKDWEKNLQTLTVEQLEKQLAELPDTPELADWQIAVRRKVITDVIESRRNSPIEVK